jgi:hypothetical protein
MRRAAASRAGSADRRVPRPPLRECRETPGRESDRTSAEGSRRLPRSHPGRQLRRTCPDSRTACPRERGGHVRGQAGHGVRLPRAGRNGGRTADNPYRNSLSVREREDLSLILSHSRIPCPDRRTKCPPLALLSLSRTGCPDGGQPCPPLPKHQRAFLATPAARWCNRPERDPTPGPEPIRLSRPVERTICRRPAHRATHPAAMPATVADGGSARRTRLQS